MKKIEKLERKVAAYTLGGSAISTPPSNTEVLEKINEIIEAVNELSREADECEYGPWGHWILEKGPDGKPYCLHCSVCDSDFRRVDVMTAYPYCPYCGTRMDDGEVDHETD